MKYLTLTLLLLLGTSLYSVNQRQIMNNFKHIDVNDYILTERVMSDNGIYLIYTLKELDMEIMSELQRKIIKTGIKTITEMNNPDTFFKKFGNPKLIRIRYHEESNDHFFSLNYENISFGFNFKKNEYNKPTYVLNNNYKEIIINNKLTFAMTTDELANTIPGITKAEPGVVPKYIYDENILYTDFEGEIGNGFVNIEKYNVMVSFKEGKIFMIQLFPFGKTTAKLSFK